MNQQTLQGHWALSKHHSYGTNPCRTLQKDYIVSMECYVRMLCTLFFIQYIVLNSMRQFAIFCSFSLVILVTIKVAIWFDLRKYANPSGRQEFCCKLCKILFKQISDSRKYRKRFVENTIV